MTFNSTTTLVNKLQTVATFYLIPWNCSQMQILLGVSIKHAFMHAQAV